jgi:hypothetical protein
MTRGDLWRWGLLALGFLIIAIGSLVTLPPLLYPPLDDATLRSLSTADARIQLQQAQSQLQNNVRSTLLQTLAGLLVLAGAAATWRQVHVNREGQITERFTRAIDQVGSENVDIRIGGIYALHRIAYNSPTDRNSIQFILSAFIRNHAVWPIGMPDGPEHPTSTVDEHLPWLQVRAPDIQAAIGVLGNRPPTPEYRQLYLSRVDLRGVQLDSAQLANVQIRHANLARGWLRGAQLDGSDLKATDLRQANLQGARLIRANLQFAHLAKADLQGANLTNADLRGADFTGANLEAATLLGARADVTTTWPEGFDAEQLRALGVSITV